jgi:hypothetical protein
VVVGNAGAMTSIQQVAVARARYFDFASRHELRHAAKAAGWFMEFSQRASMRQTMPTT